MSRDTILILNCPEDSGWLLRLLSYLRPYERQGTFDVWDESRVLPGELTRSAFRKALRRASAVVLLISADFVASDLIAQERLPELLDLVQEDAIRLLPLFVRPSITVLCYHSLQSGRLVQFDLQARAGLNSPASALSQLRRPQQEQELVRIAAAIQRSAPWTSTPWVRALADLLETVPRHRFLDYSSRRPTRILCKLETLFDLPVVLSRPEQDVLIASAYARTLLDATGAVDFPANLPIPPSLRLEAERVVMLPPASIVAMPGAESGMRYGLLAGLLWLGCALDRDHASLRDDAGTPPQETTEWLIYFTREVCVLRGGVVTFHLCPTQKSLGPALRRVVALGFELLWQSVRPTLTRHGLALAISPCCEELQAGAMPDPEWRSWLTERASEVEQQVFAQRIQHLGAEVSLQVETLLPLPNTAVLDDMSLFLDSGWEYWLRLSNDAGEEVTIELSASDGETRRVGLSHLHPGVWNWFVTVDYGTGTLQPVAAGRIRRLPDKERAAVARGRPAAGAPSLSLFTRYGLLDDLLRSVWPRLAGSDSAPEEILLAFRLVNNAYRFIEEACPTSRQLERYGHASTWLSERLGLGFSTSTETLRKGT